MAPRRADRDIRPEPLTEESFRDLRLPEPGGSKRDRGDVLVIGGSRKTPGAVALSGLAALRVGAGRLTLAVADSVAPALAVALPEAGVIGLPETAGGSVDGDCLDQVRDDLDAGCLVIGPGLDDAEQTTRLLQRVVPAIPDGTTVLLDAFALGCLGSDPELGERLKGRLVLTPNETEAGILLDRKPVEAGPDLLEIADRYGAVVSSRSMVADPAGGLWQLDAGNAGLGTSGSGDVLAGAAAGLIARGTDASEAVRWATFLHAEAGDRLSMRIGPLGFLARELVDELPHVLTRLA